MIEAEMYGMIPRANTETFRRPPPENMSNRPNRVPATLSKKWARAPPSTPGTGICTPIRYAQRRPSVQSSFVRSSGERARLSAPPRATSHLPFHFQFFDFTASGADLIRSGLAELMRFHLDGGGEFPFAQDFHRSAEREISLLPSKAATRRAILITSYSTLKR